MELDFLALLSGSAAVSAMVPIERISWGVLAQGQPLPAIVLTLVGNRNQLTQQGPTDLWRGRVQVDCYGETYSSARRVADALIDLLHGHHDARFPLIRLDAQRSKFETGPTDRPDRISLDFLTTWRQPNG